MASFERQINFLLVVLCLQTLLQIAHVSVELKGIHLRCSDSNPLEGAFSEPARLSLQPPFPVLANRPIP